MTRWILAALGGLAIVSAPASGWARQAPPESAKIQAFSLEKTQALGRAMYIQDQAAWRATDLMMAAKPDVTGLFGWVATPYAGGRRVRFLKGSPESPQAAYEVVFDGKTKPTFQLSKEAGLSGDEAAQMRALATAMDAGSNSCGSHPPNHIEIRDPDSGEWLVWLLSPWTKADGIPMGGHTRFTISSDGSTLIRKEAMSRACLGMKPPARGEKSPMMFVTQLVADSPLENHVFNALQAKLPIAVATPDGSIWLVDGREISSMGKLDDLKKGKPSAPPRSGSSTARP